MSIARGSFLTPESAGDDPDLLLALARIEMADAGGDPRPRADAPADRRARPPCGRAALLCEEVAAAGAVDSAYHGVDVVTDVALLEGDFDRAIEALHAFLGHAAHTAALVKLVEVCVDAGRSEPMREAQARLADAYLETGHAVEARVIAEDLLAADPQSGVHAQRLRRALEMLGVKDIRRGHRASPSHRSRKRHRGIGSVDVRDAACAFRVSQLWLPASAGRMTTRPTTSRSRLKSISARR